MTLVARDLIHAPPLTIPAAMPLLEVQRLFVTTEIGGAPVVDEQGAVLGMITSHDLLRAHDQVSDDEIDEGEDEAEGLARWSARDLATPDVAWVPPELPIREVAAIMRARGLHRVLVGTDGKLAGVVSSFDLLRAIAP